MKIFSLASMLLVIALIIGCIKPPDYPVEPNISFKSLSKNTMKQGQSPNDDFLYLTINFTDGDGDIGNDAGDTLTKFNIEITDTRDNSVIPYKAPIVPLIGANNGISGEIELKLFTSCCLYSDGFRPCEAHPSIPADTLSYKVVLVDRAGHKSNVIETPPIYLDCK